MVDLALKPKIRAAFFSEETLKALIVSLLVYWGVYALIAPVTNSDSQVYNLARLSIAERAGFWQTTAWNSIRQVIFPWAFDAIHYPFLKIGWGSALPSFVCFFGLLIIIFELVVPKFGSKVGLWSILILLSMPTLMLQATTTKNDLVIAFGVGCWLYSLVRFRRNHTPSFSLRGRFEFGVHYGLQDLSAANLRDSDSGDRLDISPTTKKCPPVRNLFRPVANAFWQH